MIAFIDAYLLPLLFCLPIVGMLYVNLIPKADIGSMRQVVTFAVCLMSCLFVRAACLWLFVDQQISWQLNISIFLPLKESSIWKIGISEILLLLPVYCMAFGLLLIDTHSIENLGLVWVNLFFALLWISLVALTSTSYFQVLCWALMMQGLLAISLAFNGKREKGTAILQSALFFLVVDLCGFLAYFASSHQLFHPDKIAMMMMLPALIRLLPGLVYPVQKRGWLNSSNESFIMTTVVTLVMGAKLALLCPPFFASSEGINETQILTYILLGTAVLLGGLALLKETSPFVRALLFIQPSTLLFVIQWIRPFEEPYLFLTQVVLVNGIMAILLYMFFIRQAIDEHGVFCLPHQHYALRYIVLLPLIGIPYLGRGVAYVDVIETAWLGLPWILGCALLLSVLLTAMAVLSEIRLPLIHQGMLVFVGQTAYANTRSVWRHMWIALGVTLVCSWMTGLWHQYNML